MSDPTGTDTYNAATNPQGTNLNKLDAVYSDLVAPAGTPNAGEPSEIHERINYYVGDGVGADRATRYSEIDVYNESYHTGVNGGASSIWNRLTPQGVVEHLRRRGGRRRRWQTPTCGSISTSTAYWKIKAATPMPTGIATTSKPSKMPMATRSTKR